MKAVVNLHDPAALKRLLKQEALWTDKGLGQHFLVSEPAVRSIVDATGDAKGILEIGPGPGVLTQSLCREGVTVSALEIDSRYVRLLAKTAPEATVVPGDALEADLAALLDVLPTPRFLVSNLPYYITSPLLQRFADARAHFDGAVLMMQREVAARIAAKPGHSDRGSLSVYLQAMFEIERVVDVPASAFMPPPKVDSRVLKLTPRREEVPEDVFKIVRFGFSQPRKTLANNLASGLHRERDAILDLLEALGMAEKVRAQELTLAEWRALSEKLAV